MKSCRLLLEDDMRPIAEELCSALRCELTVVDSEPVWQEQNRRVFQVDMPDFHYRMLEELGRITGSSPEGLLHEWIEEREREKASGKGGRSMERCRLMVEWLGLGFTGKEPDLRHFAQRLARV
jgi:hypothetical protein